MAKRQKHVYPTNEIPHLWIYQRQDSARNQGGNLYFREKSIYSYGSHFEIARIIDSNTVFFTVRTYSNTTAKHISMTRGAIPSSKTIFKVISFNYHSENIERYFNVLTELLSKIKNARSHYNLMQYNRDFIETRLELREYSQRFKELTEQEASNLLSLNLQHDTLFSAEKIDKCKDYDNKREEREEKRIKAERENNLKRNLEAIEKFKTDLSFMPNYYYNYEHDYIRVNGDFIQTIRGVKVSLDLCKKLYNKIKAKEDIKGYNLDSYTVISLNGTLKIGCHNIPIEEINRIAKQLNW